MLKLSPEDKLVEIRKLVSADPFTAPSMKAVTPRILAILDAGEPKKPKKQSRPERWSAAASDASDALQRLVSLQEEYQEWRDNLPENLASGTLAEKLDEVCAIDVQGAADTADEAGEADLPRGFGKD